MKTTKRLAGNPAATLTEAHKTLKVAIEETRGQRTRSLKARQGAEKVWLAATTTADALVGPTSNASQVFDAFKRAWGAKGEQIAKNIQTSLHVGCFYSNSIACDGPYVLQHARILGRIIRSPIRDRQLRAKVKR